MDVIRDLAGWPADGPTVAAIGNFDGVHRGHQEILGAVVHEARQIGARAAAVTFAPHPSRVLAPQTAPRLLTPGAEKLRWLASLGLDAVLELPFTRDLSLWPPREFVERVLVHSLRAVAVHEGENFRFGNRHAGSVATLAELGREFGFTVHTYAAVRVRGEVVSSSRLRELLALGRVGTARAMLGRPFGVCGLIAPGRGIGRQRTVPTLNLQHYEEALPDKGVYATCVRLRECEWAALTNIGVRPTFGPGGPLTVESHLLHPPASGLDAPLGEEIDIRFLRRVRDERRFDSPEQLRAQIQADATWAARYFHHLDKIRLEVS